MSIEAEKVQMDLDDSRLRVGMLEAQLARLVEAAKQSRGWLDEQTVGDGYLIEETTNAEKLLTPETAEPKKDQ